jgi:precorrin-2/cobalt-factor-2 C20-methyltransferase
MTTLVGVGVGPGDPELVTVKAVRVLREADVVFVPVMAGPGATGPGRAETTIRAHIAGDRIRPVPFALNDTGGVTERRAAAWQAAAAEVARAFEDGAGTVAFGTIGDPNLYSTFSYLAQTVRGLVPGLTVQTVPGITAMQDLAARSGTVLAEGDEPLTLLPLTAGTQAFRDALTRPGTVVGYKLGAAAGPTPAEVTRLLATLGRLDGAVVGARQGLPGQDIRPAKDLAQLPAVPYLSTLIAPARRTAPGSSLASARQREAPPAPGSSTPPISSATLTGPEASTAPPFTPTSHAPEDQ